jgi:AcrR family transcriptional regulator
MSDTTPKWRRRKTDRPAEIIDAALAVFAEKGFAAARLDDIARRAGLSKGALYLYFEAKEDIFRAVVRAAVAPNLQVIATAAEGFEGPFEELAQMFLLRAARAIGSGPLPAVIKMVIGESRNFPDLARIWHDDVIAVMIELVSRIVARGQARGEVAPGDPRLYALSLIGPMLAGALYREVFAGTDGTFPDLEALAGQHARTAFHGMLIHPGE